MSWECSDKPLQLPCAGGWGWGRVRSWNVFCVWVVEAREGYEWGRDRAGDDSFLVGFLIDSGSNLDVPGEG